MENLPIEEYDGFSLHEPQSDAHMYHQYMETLSHVQEEPHQWIQNLESNFADFPQVNYHPPPIEERFESPYLTAEVHSTHHEDVKPDFTPLMSPAVTPRDTELIKKAGKAFSPLTSPALECQNTSPVLRTRKASYGRKQSLDSNKRNSITTPTLTGRVVKQSPHLQARRPNYSKSSKDFKLPESADNTETMPPPAIPDIKSQMDPSSKMMSFTFQKLESVQSNGSQEASPEYTQYFSEQPRDDVVTNNARITSNSPPVILQSSQTRSATSTSANQSPQLLPGDKRMSHKLAEQGRRNRMNVAVQELEKMLPDNLVREVSVPSKATTVELACRYIQQLEEELARIKR